MNHGSRDSQNDGYKQSETVDEEIKLKKEQLVEFPYAVGITFLCGLLILFLVPYGIQNKLKYELVL